MAISFKALSKKKKITLIIIASLVIVGAVLGIVLPLTLKAPTVPTVTFDAFDQISDLTVTARWKSIKKAVAYDVEYTYFVNRGLNSEDKAVIDIIEKSRKAVAENSITVDRKKGALKVRVRAVFEETKGEYSEWKHIEILPLTLDAPEDKDGRVPRRPYFDEADGYKLKWKPVTYKFGRFNVPKYKVLLYANGDYLPYHEYYANPDDGGTTIELFKYLYSLATSKVEYTEETWVPISITVEIKALNRDAIDNNSEGPNRDEFLYDAYEESVTARLSAPFVIDYSLYMKVLKYA